MKYLLFIFVSLFGFSIATNLAFALDETIRVPKTVEILSSQPRLELWNSLSEQEKSLLYHFNNAVEASRPLLLFQSHRYAIKIKHLFDVAFSRHNIHRTRRLLGPKDFDELLRYSVIFYDQNGVYTGNKKMNLTSISKAKFEKLLKYLPDLLPNEKNEIVRLFVDPNFETLHHSETEDGKGIENTGGNMYEKGITGNEIVEALAAGLKIDLNTRVVRGSDGQLKLQVMSLAETTLPKEIKKALQQTIRELKIALNFALTEHQNRQIAALILYLEKGNIDDFRTANMEWVKDGTSSKVDLVMGWTEVYMDHRNAIGTWECYIQIVDREISKQAKTLAEKAQYFEDKMPYGQFKKTFPPGYAPPVMFAYWFKELSFGHYSGFNLPNFDDIRRDVGAKNSIKIRFPGERSNPSHVALRHANIQEFTADSVRDQVVAQYWEARDRLVLLHEVIGHGSGTYDQQKYAEKEDPTVALGVFGSALEEERSDLVGIVFANDPLLVDLGFYKNQDEANRTAKSLYEGYMTEVLSFLALEQSFSEAHLRGQLLFVNRLLKRGAVVLANKNGSSEWTADNVVFLIKDYDLFKSVATELLAELQNIKSNREEDKLKAMFENESSLETIKTKWAQGVIARGKKIQIDAKSIDQSWLIDKSKKFLLKGNLTLSSAVQNMGLGSDKMNCSDYLKAR